MRCVEKQLNKYAEIIHLKKHNKKAKITKLFIFNALSNSLYFGACDKKKVLKDNERLNDYI